MLVLQCGSGSPGAWPLKGDSWQPSHAHWDSRGLPFTLHLSPSVTASLSHSGLRSPPGPCGSCFLHLEVFLKPYRLSENASSRKSSLSEDSGTHCPHHLAEGNLLSEEVFKSFSYLNMSCNYIQSNTLRVFTYIFSFSPHDNPLR